MHDLITTRPARAVQATALDVDCALAVSSDVDAMNAWLVARGGRSIHTFNSYRREAARLLLWLAETDVGLREMKVDHAHAYYAFLANPPRHWLIPAKQSTPSVLLPTQVLRGPFSTDSLARTRTVLNLMAGYLHQAGYLARNVFALSHRPVVVVKSPTTRVLDLESWNWLWAWIQDVPRSTPRQIAHAVRIRWLFALLYHTGIRREEVANGLMGDFVRTDGAWTLRVVGKGSVERFVTVNSALLRELNSYRLATGLKEPYPLPGETTPLVASINAKRREAAMTPRAIGRIVNSVSKAAAAACPDAHHRERIVKMSTHWMRHTNATHRLMAGASLVTTQDELGHKDPKTTRIYAATGLSARRDDGEKLALLSEAIKLNNDEKDSI